MKTNQSVRGKMCIVRDLLAAGGRCLVAAVVVQRGVRLQSGEHFGELRNPGQYDLIEYCTPGEAPSFLAAAWV
jgi:hypothetical protein